jgi:hypothetical protein
MNGHIRASRATRFVFSIIIAMVGIAATGPSGAGAMGSAATVVTLHPGQSKKIGVYTVICTTGTVARTKTRIVLHPGYAVTVRGVRVRCLRLTVPTPTPVPIPVPPPAPQPGARTNPYPLGTRAASSTWALTVNSTNFDAWPVIQAANIFNSPPSPGGQDVMANLTISYLGPGSTTLTDLIIHLGVVGSGGVEYRSFTNDCGVLPSPREIDYSTLFSGATIQLNLCWQVALADVASLEFVYNEQSWFALK